MKRAVQRSVHPGRWRPSPVSLARFPLIMNDEIIFHLAMRAQKNE